MKLSTWQHSKKWGYIAAVAMLPYAMLKTLWAFEVNIGISLEMLSELHANMTIYGGPVVNFLYRHGIDITAVLAIVASLLSLALVQSWGQTFPKWMPYFGGRSVPRWLLLIPAWLGGMFFAIQFAIVMVQIIFQMITIDTIHLDSGCSILYTVVFSCGESSHVWLLAPIKSEHAISKIENNSQRFWFFGACLGMVAVGGTILTLGLIQHWGENFPRWFPFISGKRVPLPLAIIPASLVSIMVTSAGFMYLSRFWRNGGLDEEGWSLSGPELLWPVWGVVALAGATLAYYYRRRGRCNHCHQL